MKHEYRVWRAVRCCCQPTKILGFLAVDAEAREIRFAEYQSTNAEYQSTIYAEPPKLLRNIGEHTFYIKQMASKEDEKIIDELAISSEEKPIEFWRNIKGFMEVKEQR